MPIRESIAKAIDRANTRDILSLIGAGVFAYGTISGIFDPKEALLVISMVFAFWFGKKTNGV